MIHGFFETTTEIYVFKYHRRYSLLIIPFRALLVTVCYHPRPLTTSLDLFDEFFFPFDLCQDSRDETYIREFVNMVGNILLQKLCVFWIYITLVCFYLITLSSSTLVLNKPIEAAFWFITLKGYTFHMVYDRSKSSHKESFVDAESFSFLNKISYKIRQFKFFRTTHICLQFPRFFGWDPVITDLC